MQSLLFFCDIYCTGIKLTIRMAIGTTLIFKNYSIRAWLYQTSTWQQNPFPSLGDFTVASLTPETFSSYEALLAPKLFKK
jgi:hypothetical protein